MQDLFLQVGAHSPGKRFSNGVFVFMLADTLRNNRSRRIRVQGLRLAVAAPLDHRIGVTIQQTMAHHRAFKLVRCLAVVRLLVQQKIHRMIAQPFSRLTPVIITHAVEVAGHCCHRLTDN
ncbi:hypothetical protein D3C76_1097070 [compost metagenome]